MHKLLPRTADDFAKREYWDKFFQTRQSTFEWYGDFLDHSEFFTKYVKKTDRVLIVGCGNSDLGVMLFDRLDVADVVNIDISDAIVRQMREKHCSHGARSGLTYECMDVFTLERRVQNEELKPFTCVLDKGTLDAIHSEKQSELNALNMFRNIDSTLGFMGRYIIITLAQEHIVQTISKYFILGVKQWLVNCHQLTSNRRRKPPDVESDVFPLPVFGFVLTKLRPADGLPRVTLFPPDQETPILLNGNSDDISEQLKSWISQEQNWSLLRRDFSKGNQTRLRFSCPRTGLTVFCAEVVKSDQSKVCLSQSKRIQQSTSTNKIEAVFFVPFGQNDNPAFQMTTRRQNLCQLLNVGSLLLVFSNPRYFHPDLDTIKGKLSGVLGGLELGQEDTHGAPLLSTPDGYIREEVELTIPKTDLYQLRVDHVQFRLSDHDSVLTLKRLVAPSAQLRPILATNAYALPARSVMAPRDVQLGTWIELLTRPNGCSHVISYGLPHIGPFHPHRTRHFQIHLAGAKIGSEVAIQKGFSTLYADEPETMVCKHCDKPLLSWSAAHSEIQSETPVDLVLYDPIAVDTIDYAQCFTLDHLSHMAKTCAKLLNSHGWFILAVEDASSASPYNTLGSLTRVLSYFVADPLFQDPHTRIDIFHQHLNSESARNELLQRLKDRKHQGTADTSNQHGTSDIWDQIETILTNSH